MGGGSRGETGLRHQVKVALEEGPVSEHDPLTRATARSRGEIGLRRQVKVALEEARAFDAAGVDLLVQVRRVTP